MQCDYHLYYPASERLQDFFDPNSEPIELGSELKTINWIKFRDRKRYPERVSQAKKESGASEALLAMVGSSLGLNLVACAFEYRFIAGSMGTVVGERFALAADYAFENRLPLVCFSASGGARMQEGIFSLLQMAKTASCLARLKRARIPYISILTNPTMGGVSASLANLGDIIIAEPKALIGFSGPRVIEKAIGKSLPPGFQTSEFLLDSGGIDMIVERSKLKSKINGILKKLGKT